MMLLCRNKTPQVKTQNLLKHQVWHADPWPVARDPVSFLIEIIVVIVISL